MSDSGVVGLRQQLTEALTKYWLMRTPRRRWVEQQRLVEQVDTLWPLVSAALVQVRQDTAREIAEAIRKHRDYLWEITNHGSPSWDVLTKAAQIAARVGEGADNG